MDFDVVIVGAGPAGLATAIDLRQCAAQAGEKISIVVAEKGSEVGAHILSGAVIDPSASMYSCPTGGPTVIWKDTPGFIGNRIGNYWMVVAQNEAIELGLEVEEADAVIGKPFGIPSTGIIGLLDLVGIDLMPTILGSLQNATPAGEAVKGYDAGPQLIARMIAGNCLGRKSGAGFVRLSPDRKSRDVTDLKTGEYRQQKVVFSDSLDTSGGNPRALMEYAVLGGRYASILMEKALAYAASPVAEIADTPDAVDEAMRVGYDWKQGPFELIDRLGAGWLKARLEARGVAVPTYLSRAAAKGGFYSVVDGKRANLLPDGSIAPVHPGDGVLLLSDLKLAGKPVEDWGAVSLWDLRDGVAAFNLIAPAKVSTSTFKARNLGYLKAADGITMNRNRLIADVKKKALALAERYVAPEPPDIAMSGASAFRNIIEGEALAGRTTVHDGVVGRALANILTGGLYADPLKPLMEDDVSTLEREAFVDLLATPATVDRVKHMLATGKPLRN